MAKILLIIPGYNEEDNILKVCNYIKEYNKKNEQKYDYVVINDGSTDKTLEILKQNKLNYIDLVHNLGIGGAVQTGYLYGCENDYDIAVQFDGDGQHDINYVSKICKPIIDGQADMCIGTRYLEKAESKFQSTFMRRFGSKIISLVIKIFCGKTITDPTSGFRAVNKEVMAKFAKDYPKDYPEPESTVSLLVGNYNIKEVPVSMNPREGGTSSIGLLDSANYMVRVVLAIIIDSVSLRNRRKK